MRSARHGRTNNSLMNHRTLLPALFLGVLSVACTQQKSTAQTTPKVQSSTTAQPTKPTTAPKGRVPRFGGAGVADSLFYTLEKTPCFGTCKSYRINVYKSGYATFEGRSNVEKIGMHYGRVGKDSLETLMKSAEDMGFYKLNDKYDNNATDLPSSIIRIIGMGKDKKVIGRAGTPASFTSLVAKAEGLLYPIAWKPLAPKE